MSASKRLKDGSAVNIKDGRKRFHGAFTGGFSAGYQNTVGSRDGWSSQQMYTSSAGNRATMRQQRPEDFMDEEDGLLGARLTAKAAFQSHLTDYTSAELEKDRAQGVWGDLSSMPSELQVALGDESRSSSTYSLRQQADYSSSSSSSSGVENVGLRLLKLMGGLQDNKTTEITVPTHHTHSGFDRHTVGTPGAGYIAKYGARSDQDKSAFTNDGWDIHSAEYLSRIQRHVMPLDDMPTAPADRPLALAGGAQQLGGRASPLRSSLHGSGYDSDGELDVYESDYATSAPEGVIPTNLAMMRSITDSVAVQPELERLPPDDIFSRNVTGIHSKAHDAHDSRGLSSEKQRYSDDAPSSRATQKCLVDGRAVLPGFVLADTHSIHTSKMSEASSTSNDASSSGGENKGIPTSTEVPDSFVAKHVFKTVKGSTKEFLATGGSHGINVSASSMRDARRRVYEQATLEPPPFLAAADIASFLGEITSGLDEQDLLELQSDGKGREVDESREADIKDIADAFQQRFVSAKKGANEAVKSSSLRICDDEEDKEFQSGSNVTKPSENEVAVIRRTSIWVPAPLLCKRFNISSKSNRAVVDNNENSDLPISVSSFGKSRDSAKPELFYEQISRHLEKRAGAAIEHGVPLNDGAILPINRPAYSLFTAIFTEENGGTRTKLRRSDKQVQRPTQGGSEHADDAWKAKRSAGDGTDSSRTGNIVFRKPNKSTKKAVVGLYSSSNSNTASTSSKSHKKAPLLSFDNADGED